MNMLSVSTALSIMLQEMLSIYAYFENYSTKIYVIVFEIIFFSLVKMTSEMMKFSGLDRYLLVRILFTWIIIVIHVTNKI
jgi:hypothetical protein